MGEEGRAWGWSRGEDGGGPSRLPGVGEEEPGQCRPGEDAGLCGRDTWAPGTSAAPCNGETKTQRGRKRAPQPKAGTCAAQKCISEPCHASQCRSAVLMSGVAVGVGPGGPSGPIEPPAPAPPSPPVGAGRWGCVWAGARLWRRVGALTLWVIMTTVGTSAYREETMQVCLQARGRTRGGRCRGTGEGCRGGCLQRVDPGCRVIWGCIGNMHVSLHVGGGRMWVGGS